MTKLVITTVYTKTSEIEYNEHYYPNMTIEQAIEYETDIAGENLMEALSWDENPDLKVTITVED